MFNFLREVAYTPFLFGLPVVAWMGVLTILTFISSGIIGFLSVRNIRPIPFEWHSRLAYAGMIIATAHALFALSAYL